MGLRDRLERAEEKMERKLEKLNGSSSRGVRSPPAADSVLC
jgi:hypothetical protein